MKNKELKNGELKRKKVAIEEINILKNKILRDKIYEFKKKYNKKPNHGTHILNDFLEFLPNNFAISSINSYLFKINQIFYSQNFFIFIYLPIFGLKLCKDFIIKIRCIFGIQGKPFPFHVISA
ncbi:unnamed protein product [marine sediment metagenome]|uniref:Uncharacterized protein n=1 Tax=marine sediment metagenome TaxID=412755 RepID=X1EYP2_9ZZZZ